MISGRWHSLIILFVVALVAIMSIVVVAVNNSLTEVVKGNGLITQTVPLDGGKEAETARIAFSSRIGFDRSGSPSGNLHVRFQKVSNPEYDNGDFQATSITSLEIISCSGSARVAKFVAFGKFNNQLGWALSGWITDLEEPWGEVDGARFYLSYGGQTPAPYDSSTSGDFFNDFNLSVGICNEEVRATRLDGGNLQLI